MCCHSYFEDDEEKDSSSSFPSQGLWSDLSRMYVVYTIRHHHALADTRSTCRQLEITPGVHIVRSLFLSSSSCSSPTKQITAHSTTVPPNKGERC